MTTRPKILLGHGIILVVAVVLPAFAFAQIEVNGLVFPTSLQHFKKTFGEPDVIQRDTEIGCMSESGAHTNIYRYGNHCFAVHSDSGRKTVKVNVLDLEADLTSEIKIHDIPVQRLMLDNTVIDRFRELIMGNSTDEIFMNLSDDPGIGSLKLVFKDHRLCSIVNECPFWRTIRMQVVVLKSGDDQLHIEVVRLLNDEEMPLVRSQLLLAEPNYFFLVALSDSGEGMGRIYGNVIHRPEQTDLLLYEVDVLEQHHRKGAGTALIERVKTLMDERGYCEAWVLTEGDNDRARAFYESVGGVLEAFPTAMYVFRGRDEG